MGRAPCCDKANVKRGPWSPDEDTALKNYLERHGTGGNWISLPHKAGLRRCGKSCRLRWLNYLRPDIKHGGFTEEEDNIICTLYKNMGSRWSVIASHLPGRTDNDVKNYWNTKLKKKFLAPKTSPSNNDNISSTKTDGFNCSFSTPITETSTNSLPCGEFGFGYNMDYQKLLQKPISSPLLAPVAFSLSTNKHSFSTLMQDVPMSGSGSGSLPIDSNWSGNGGGEFDSFLMEMGFGSPQDFLNGYGFQEKIGEAAPNSGFGYASLLASGDEKAQGRYQSVTY